MAVTFEVVIVEKLAGFPVSLSHPLRWLPINWTDVFSGLGLTTSYDHQRNQDHHNEANFSDHYTILCYYTYAAMPVMRSPITSL
jgi:hypothetical protein